MISTGGITRLARDAVGDEDDRAVFAQATGIGQGEAGQPGGQQGRQDHVAKRLPARRPRLAAASSCSASKSASTGCVAAVLEAHPQARFRTVGQPFGRELAERFGPERASAVPFAALDSYPAAMAAFDVALAPAAPSAFFTAKSDLRFLEAAALGLPVVADPVVYPTLVHGETGLHAATPDEAREHLEALVARSGAAPPAGHGRPRVRRARAGDAAAAHRWAIALATVRAGAAVAV